MRIAFIIILVALFNCASGQNIDYILKKSPIEFIEKFEIDKIKKNQVAVYLKHSSSKIENPHIFDSLKNKVVYSIQLIYTEPDKKVYNQERLNRRRLEEIKKVASFLIENNLISWSFIEQKKSEKYDSEKLFHGYIITLRPQLKGKDGLTEFEVLEKLISKNKTLCNINESDSTSKDSIGIKNSGTDKPIFKEGNQAFESYIKSKLNYSKKMFKDNVSGKMIVNFYINEWGDFSKINFQGDELTQECRSLLKKSLKEMPKWSPGVTRKGGLIGGIFRLNLFFSQESKHIYIQRFSHVGPYKEKHIYEIMGLYNIPEKVLCDSVIFRTLERNKQWKNISIVADLTCSMYPYTNQLALWFKLNNTNNPIRYLTFFNDGDGIPNSQKKVGKVGGIYQSESSNYEDVLDLAEATMTCCSGDIIENNIEATIAAIDKFPEAEELIMIADNFATPRDLKLLHKVKKPIRLILCGTYYGINVDYLNLIRKNGGSLHTMENDLTDLIEMNEGEVLNFNGRKFKIVNGDFQEVYDL